MAETKFYIKGAITKPAAHHESFKALWETKWKKLSDLGVYPFMFGSTKDFQPIIDDMIKKDFREPYDWDAYAENFFPKGEELAKKAIEAENAGEKDKASELYLRSSALYRISRFPTPRSPKQHYAWKVGKQHALKGLSLREFPVHEVLIPHKHGIEGEGDVIPVYHQVPTVATPESPAPCVIIYTGLDGYRTELAVWFEGFRQKGVAVVILEIPGTGDSPAARGDPTSPDRQNSSLLDWIDTQPLIDNKKILVWGFSTGGFYTIRMAHTHRERIMAAVALGGGCHHMFDPDWLGNVNHLEYPFDLGGSLCYKFGYGTDMETFKKEAMKFSLLEDGTLDTPCTTLFLVNGTDDEIFPIDDYYLALEHGDPKIARFVKGFKHMGEPSSFGIVLTWIFKMLDLKGSPMDIIKLLPFQAKY